ncbi:MAG: MipA/OmpV family protein [Alphaproteobacteria bacterium]|nr:MipA/OmpV family protein [Alphaproteobacteria bacterium]
MSIAQRLFLASAIAIACSSAKAADLTPAPAPVEGWIITLGLGPNVFNSFPGAKSVSIWPTGYIGYHQPGEPEPFISPDDGLSIALLDLPWIKAGPVARFISERTPGSVFGQIGNNSSFFGLHDVGFTAELGGFLELWPTDYFRARFEARNGVSGADGFDGNIELDFIQRYGDFTFAAGPRLQFGDNQFVSAYFSVSPFEAALNRSVYSYQAFGGLVAVGGLGSIKYQFTPTWSATAFGGVNRYVGSAGGSPIPNRVGSIDNFTAGVVVAYTFNWNGNWNPF